MVVGAGRGPLVTTCLKCAVEADVPIKLYAVEKNPSAVNVLRILNRDVWQGQVHALTSCYSFLIRGFLGNILIDSLTKLFLDRIQVTVVDSDMRTYTPADGELADILVSELLGSWADNELSPECLDGAQRLLKPTGSHFPIATIG